MLTRRSPKTIECGTAWTFDAPSATDVCDPAPVVTVVNTITNAGCGKTLTAIRTWKAIDACSNSAQCSQTVTVVDTTPPTITCVSPKTIECGTAWTFDAPSETGSGERRPGVTIAETIAKSKKGKTLTAIRTWKAIDACTNSAQCSQTVTVVDTTPPAITCVGPKTIECGTAWSFDAPSATDVCGPTPTITIVSTVTNAGCGNTRTATRTWQATDACTNSAQCSQTVTVVDTTAPVMNCSGSTNKIVDRGSAWTGKSANPADNRSINKNTILSTVTKTAGHCGKTFDAI